MTANALGWTCSVLAGLLAGFVGFLLESPGYLDFFMLAMFGFGLVAGMCAEITRGSKGRRRARR